LRLDCGEFVGRGAEIIALGPDGPNAFRRYWEEEHLSFIGCPDLKSKVAGQYHQEVNMLKLGRMPAIFVIDREGVIRYGHYGDSMSDIPSNEEILGVIDRLSSDFEV
jgi:peroxiredoxin Q/BCP